MVIKSVFGISRVFFGDRQFTSSVTNGMESSVVLCKCLQKTLHWLMMCILQSMKAMKDSQQQQEYISIIDAASVAALHIADNTTVQALLYVAMSEDQGKELQWCSQYSLNKAAEVDLVVIESPKNDIKCI